MTNSLLGLQIGAILFSIFMIYITFMFWKKQEYGNFIYLIFFGAWISIIVFALFPAILDPLLEGLQFKRRLDFYLMAGVFFCVSIMVYCVYVVKQMQQKVEDLVRAKAQDNYEQEEFADAFNYYNDLSKKPIKSFEAIS